MEGTLHSSFSNFVAESIDVRGHITKLFSLRLDFTVLGYLQFHAFSIGAFLTRLPFNLITRLDFEIPTSYITLHS